MSQRSILEVNHDYSFMIARDYKEFVELLARGLASGSNEAWLPLERFGVRRVVQCHHTEDRKVVVGIGPLTREHKFG
jgi:hypothetical protein